MQNRPLTLEEQLHQQKQLEHQAREQQKELIAEAQALRDQIRLAPFDEEWEKLQKKRELTWLEKGFYLAQERELLARKKREALSDEKRDEESYTNLKKRELRFRNEQRQQITWAAMIHARLQAQEPSEQPTKPLAEINRELEVLEKLIEIQEQLEFRAIDQQRTLRLQAKQLKELPQKRKAIHLENPEPKRQKKMNTAVSEAQDSSYESSQESSEDSSYESSQEPSVTIQFDATAPRALHAAALERYKDPAIIPPQPFYGAPNVSQSLLFENTRTQVSTQNHLGQNPADVTGGYRNV